MLKSSNGIAVLLCPSKPWIDSFTMDKYDVVYCKVMTDEFEVKSKTKYEVDTKGDTERDIEDAGDKIKAGAKAVANKIKDPDRDLGTEYNKEKIKEKVD